MNRNSTNNKQEKPRRKRLTKNLEITFNFNVTNQFENPETFQKREMEEEIPIEEKRNFLEEDLKEEKSNTANAEGELGLIEEKYDLEDFLKRLFIMKENNFETFDDFVKDGAYISISQDDFRPLEIEEKQKKLKRLFSQIGENCQRVLHLFYFHRLSMNAIAQELGLANEQVAKNKKSRCLKKLKAIAFKMPYKEPYG